MSDAIAGGKTALNQAIAEASRAMHVPADLFGGPALPAHGGQREGAGRPKGAKNKRTAEMARFYLRQLHRDEGFADPLLRGLAIAGKDILDGDTVQQLAEVWGCDRSKAVELYLANWRAVMPFIHQEQPRSLHVAPGTPDSGELAPVEGDIPEVPLQRGADGVYRAES